MINSGCRSLTTTERQSLSELVVSCTALPGYFLSVLFMKRLGPRWIQTQVGGQASRGGRRLRVLSCHMQASTTSSSPITPPQHTPCTATHTPASADRTAVRSLHDAHPRSPLCHAVVHLLQGFIICAGLYLIMATLGQRMTDAGLGPLVLIIYGLSFCFFNFGPG